MNILKIKHLFVILFIFILTISVSTINARNDDSIVLTKETITSLERCPLRNTVELNCKSYHQTTNYTCGPAVVMVLLHYYGKLSSQDMNQKTELRIASEMGAVPGANGGTTSSQIETWLAGHGFNIDSGQQITTDMLIADVNKGIPVIVGYNKHWILAKGYHKGSRPDQDEILFADSCCNVSIITRENIDSMWLTAHIPANHCSENIGKYIVATIK